MKKTVAILVILALLSVAVITVTGCNGGDSYKEGAIAFANRDEVEKVVEEYNDYYRIRRALSFGCGSAADNSVKKGDMANGSASSDGVSLPESSTGSSDYTSTNVQTEGVDEGDIIKADSNTIYYLSSGGLFIMDAPASGQTSLLYSQTMSNFRPIELYVSGNRLVIIGEHYEQVYVNETYENGYADCCCYYYGRARTSLMIYDISDRTNPVVLRSLTVDGGLNTSRLADGKLYILTDYYFGYGDTDDYIPTITDSMNGGEKKAIDISDMYYFEGIRSYGYLIAIKLDINDVAASTCKAYLGSGNTVYVSSNNIYVGIEDYSLRYSKDAFGYYEYDYSQKDRTRIVKFSLDDLSYKAAAYVEGTLNDRFSMDEYDGYLRVATTTTGSFTQYSSVIVLDADFKEVGSVSGIALGERIYSARFNGETASIVTFRQVDPLFKVDLSDPKNPKVSDGLKKEGVSYYLHYIEGTNYLIGLGRDTENGTSLGIEVALFNTSGAENVLINKIVIGADYAYADALYDANAILYDKDKDIFAFAITSYDYDNSDYRYYSYTTSNAYYVFGFSDGKLTQRAVLSETRVSQNRYDNYVNWSEYEWAKVQRGARIGNNIYTVSNACVTAFSLEDFSETSRTQLTTAENAGF